MAYKCRICGSNDVEHLGDVCELCAIGQDPYAAALQGDIPSDSQKYTQVNNDFGHSHTAGRGRSRKILIDGGASIKNTDPYGNSMVPTVDEDESVQVYHAGQVPVAQQTSDVVNSGTKGSSVNASAKGTQPITCGITKNIAVDNQKRSFLGKWFKSLFSGIPFTLDNDVTTFQVFPDYTGTSLNALGNACDQVVVYGKLNAGAISENNEIEVFGHRDSNNIIVAKTIKNKASGTTVTPDRTIPAGVVWAITLIMFVLIFSVVTMLGSEGIVWTIIILLCLTNLPLILKIVGVIFGLFFSIIKKLF